MNVMEYLQQGRRLDQRINFNLRRMQEMKDGLCGLRSPQMDQERVQTSRSEDAPFVRALIKVEEMQERLKQETDLLAELRGQIEETIRSVPSGEYQMLLMYRYLEGWSWAEIGDALRIGISTAKRWHEEALKQVRMPEHPIRITQGDAR